MTLFLSCGIAMSQDTVSVYETRDESMLHPVDLLSMKTEPHHYQQSSSDLTSRERVFKSFIAGPLDNGNYARISRGVGCFVALYHAMTEEELAEINRAKEVLEDEITDVMSLLVASSTVIELHKSKLRRTGCTMLLRQTCQEKITAAEATLLHDQKNLNRLLEDIGLLAAIVEEES